MSKFIVYGTSVCPACNQAKALLKSKDLEFTFVNIDLSPADQARVISYWGSLNRRPTVPLIFDETADAYVGNYDQLVQYLK